MVSANLKPCGDGARLLPVTESEQCLDEVRLVPDDGWSQQPGGLRPGGAPAELPGGYRNIAQRKFEQPENMIDPHIE